MLGETSPWKDEEQFRFRRVWDALASSWILLSRLLTAVVGGFIGVLFSPSSEGGGSGKVGGVFGEKKSITMLP